MDDLVYLIRNAKFKIIAFYPYTSYTCDNLLHQSFNFKTPESELLQVFWDKMWLQAEELGCQFDNKIVLEIKPIVNSRKSSSLFLGNKDGLISLGLSMSQDKWLEELKRNTYFT